MVDQRDTSQTTESRWVLNGSTTCPECKGRGEVFLGVRHGSDAWSLCPVCRGNTVIPLWKEVQNVEQ